MIRGVHTMFYSSEPNELRAFLRDRLGFSSYTDVGDGWLIFNLPEADMGCHPADDQPGSTSGTPSISFYCDDIEKTVKELQARGVEFTKPIENHGYGLVTFFKVPGNFELQLYQPLYQKKMSKPVAKKVNRGTARGRKAATRNAKARSRR